MNSEIKITIEENGRQKTGTLVSYIPEKRMIVRLNNGSIIELTYDAKTKIFSLETSINRIEEGKASGNPLYIVDVASQEIAVKRGGFGPGTLILMADGTERPIEKIRAGDKIISFGEYDSSGPLIAKRVLDTYERIDEKTTEITLTGSSYPPLRVHPDQLFIGTDDVWNTIDQIDLISDKLGERRPFRYSPVNGNSFFIYNIDVEGTNTFIANGIRVHDSISAADSEKFAASYQLVQIEQRADVLLNGTGYYGTPMLPPEIASAMDSMAPASAPPRDKSLPTVTNLSSSIAILNSFVGATSQVNVTATPPAISQATFDSSSSTKVPSRTDRVLNDASNTRSIVSPKVVFEGSQKNYNFNLIKSNAHK